MTFLMSIKWEYILNEIGWPYAKLAAICVTYFFTKIYVAQNKSSQKPHVVERLWQYIKCTVVIFIIAVCVWVLSPEAPARGFIVFGILILPALYGVSEGYKTTERYPVPHDSQYDDI